MEYRIAQGWKFFCILISAAFSFGAICLIVFALNHMAPGLLVLGFILLAPAIGIYLDSTRLVLTVDQRSLTLVRLFTARSILLEDIDGYRRGDKNVFSIWLKNGGKSLQLPQMLERRKELIGWFEEKYEDIDARECDTETQALLENDEFGFTREDREGRLQAARKIDTVSSVAGFVFFFWALFIPRPYEVVMIGLFIMPWVAVYITWYYKGLMRLYKKKRSPYPSVVLLMWFTILSVFLSCLRDFHLYGFEKNAWSLLIGGSLLGTAICVMACRKAIASSTKKILTYGCIVVMAGLYSWSLLVFSNCYYDRSEPQVYNVHVTHKRIYHGKSTSYYVSLSPWGKFADGKEVSVSKSFYTEVVDGDPVQVYLKKGKWGVPWYIWGAMGNGTQ